MMWTLLGLMALHAAALYHYFFRHDGVLQRMLLGFVEGLNNKIRVIQRRA